MHYHHAYHAGNFADVFKHAILCALLEALSRKAKPWCYIDTHAGAGLYSLTENSAGEWHTGVGRLWDTRPEDATLSRYLTLVRSVAGDGEQPARYPGSPWLAARMARAGDRVLACESQPDVVAGLRRAVPQAELLQRDGYELHTLLPPPERRGLVLIDPPFERHDEFDAARAFITQAAPRFAGGVFALWYPLKNPHQANHALRCLVRDTGQPMLDLRLDIGGRGDGRMHACGVAVLKPPYGFEHWVSAARAELVSALGPQARVEIQAHG